MAVQISTVNDTIKINRSTLFAACKRALKINSHSGLPVVAVVLLIRFDYDKEKIKQVISSHILIKKNPLHLLTQEIPNLTLPMPLQSVRG